MRKVIFVVFCIAAAYLLTSSSIWEGAGAVANEGELPAEGLFIATNAFPVNTFVDVTNLENGRTVRVTALRGHEIPGILALLSTDAASAIGLPGRTLGRIRMSQASDPLSVSHLSDGIASSGDPDYDPAAFVAWNRNNPNLDLIALDPPSLNTEEHIVPQIITDSPALSSINEGENTFVDFADIEEEAWILSEDPDEAIDETAVARTTADHFIDENNFEEPVIEIPAQVAAEVPDYVTPDSTSMLAAAPEASIPPAPLPPPAVPAETAPLAAPASPPLSDMEISLVPAGDRPPVADPVTTPDDSLFIPSIETEQIVQAPVEQTIVIPDTYVLPPSPLVTPAPVFILDPPPPAPQPIPEPAPVQTAGVNYFSVPMIDTLESGMYYLQIGAYSRIDAVEAEISAIDRSLPVAIMSIGSSDNPIYRILIGPMNLGESGAMLHRFRTTHSDAFVRQGI